MSRKLTMQNVTEGVIWLLTVVSSWNALEALLLCYPVSWVLTATVFSITYFRGNWLRKRMEAAV